MRKVLGLIAMSMVACSGAEAAGPFTLTSTSFADGAVIPLKYTGKMEGNANCPGSNVSPQLSWSNLPDGTQSIAILMIDPEGRAPVGVNHWIAYGIPTSRTSFAEGEVSQPPVGYMGGKSTQGLDHYMGPCTGPNTTWHHYTWVALALDLPPDAIPAGLNREEFTVKVAGHVKGSSGFTGRFKHQ